MTLDEANRILRDPLYVRELVGKTIKNLEMVSVLSIKPAEVVERQGVVRGLNMVEHLFRTAEATLSEAAAATEEEAAPPGPLPVNFMETMMDPVRVPESPPAAGEERGPDS